MKICEDLTADPIFQLLFLRNVLKLQGWSIGFWQFLETAVIGELMEGFGRRFRTRLLS